MSDEMNINSTETAEWVVEFWKGGPGSGEPVGHPFRGNRYTGGVQSSTHHRDRNRPHARNYGHAQHLTAAHGHVMAAQAAMAAGEHGIARHHFNEAAYHAAKASDQIQHGGGNREMGHHAEALYHAAHHAGDAAERAGYLTNRHQAAVSRGRETTTVNADQLYGTTASGRATATRNTETSYVNGRPVTTQLIPDGSNNSRVIHTEDLANVAAGARDNATRAATIAQTISEASNAARSNYAEAGMTPSGRSIGSGPLASGQ